MGQLVNDFLHGGFWQSWDSENRSPGSAGMILADPERFDRCYEAAGEGCDGSTHAEIIEDWRAAVNSLHVADADCEGCNCHKSECESCTWGPGAGTDFDAGTITAADLAALLAEIDDCETWHNTNGSLQTALG